MRMKSHFHMNGCAPSFALRKRFKEIRKWPNSDVYNIARVAGRRRGGKYKEEKRAREALEDRGRSPFSRAHFDFPPLLRRSATQAICIDI